MFDPVGIPGWSEEARALDAPELTAQARLGERLLRLDPALYDTLDAEHKAAWADMILLQVAFQLEHSASLVRQNIGDLHQTFRAEGPVSSGARVLRDQWFAGGTATAPSDGSWGLNAVYEDEP